MDKSILCLLFSYHKSEYELRQSEPEQTMQSHVY